MGAEREPDDEVVDAESDTCRDQRSDLFCGTRGVMAGASGLPYGVRAGCYESPAADVGARRSERTGKVLADCKAEERHCRFERGEDDGDLYANVRADAGQSNRDRCGKFESPSAAARTRLNIWSLCPTDRRLKRGVSGIGTTWCCRCSRRVVEEANTCRSYRSPSSHRRASPDSPRAGRVSDRFRTGRRLERVAPT